jgi:hypothetical protein
MRHKIGLGGHRVDDVDAEGDGVARHVHHECRQLARGQGRIVLPNVRAVVGEIVRCARRGGGKARY